MVSDHEQPPEETSILIVDDEEPQRRLISSALRHNYSCVTAESAEEAVELLRVHDFNLVLSDIRMPGASGLELCQLVSRACPETVVILVSGMTDIQYAIEAMRQGAFDYIVKPFDLPHLVVSVERALRYQALLSMRGREQQAVELAARQRSAEAMELRLENERLLRESESYRNERIFRAISGSVAHDLKGELSHLSSAAAGIRELAIGNHEIEEECDLIERSGVYARLLVQRLLNSLQMPKLKREAIPLRPLLEEVRSVVTPRLPSKVALHFQVPEEILRLAVAADRDQLLGAIVEIVSNAVKALRNKGGTIRIVLENGEVPESGNAEGAKQRPAVLLSIVDTGPGIQAELQEKLLKEPVESINGTGLGLFLYNRVIESFGGALTFGSSDSGTAFTLKLPGVSPKSETPS